ncbi:hypothetical protein [Flavobacterium sp. H122]|uniref:hypothetical protein n=1 Tax=Flavobacterium sp. H122 TaxID=2529860 RepID=UPI0010AA2873|nr:hypothetical protein [Flavobacterium sp. H122]
MKLIDDFKPPIKSRTTKELIEIAASPEKWNEVAFQLAQEELTLREVDPTTIKQRRRSLKQSERNESNKVANEPFCFFTLDPFEGFINWGEVAIFLFSWELEKDGFTRKAGFQKTYRPFLIVVLLLTLFILFLGKL